MMLNMDTKVCKKCGVEYPIECFYMKNKKSKYRRGTCKFCDIKKAHERRLNITEEQRIERNKRKKIYYRANIEKARERDRSRRKNNVDKVRAKRKITKLKYKATGKYKIWDSCCYIIKKHGLRPSACSVCGFVGNVHAHHLDYNKPYEVVFLCPSCHGMYHSGCLQITEDKITKLEPYFKNKHKIPKMHT